MFCLHNLHNFEELCDFRVFLGSPSIIPTLEQSQRLFVERFHVSDVRCRHFTDVLESELGAERTELKKITHEKIFSVEIDWNSALESCAGDLKISEKMLNLSTGMQGSVRYVRAQRQKASANIVCINVEDESINFHL